MTVDTSALEALDREPTASARRFDAGPPLRGQVAVLPAAFNPPTVAHLALLEVARSAPRVTATAALLSTKNVDKGVHGATLDQRVDMLLAAREGGAGFAVLASNMARLADQAVALRTAFPEAAFDFVVGFDTLIRLFEPRYYDDMPRALRPFLERHRVIATNRGERGTSSVDSFLASPAVRPYRDSIVVLELPLEHAVLSSTLARADAARGEASPAVPAPVASYIKRQSLYLEQDTC